jgi:hypothetical protein
MSCERRRREESGYEGSQQRRRSFGKFGMIHILPMLHYLQTPTSTNKPFRKRMTSPVQYPLYYISGVLLLSEGVKMQFVI